MFYKKHLRLLAATVTAFSCVVGSAALAIQNNDTIVITNGDLTASPISGNTTSVQGGDNDRYSLEHTYMVTSGASGRTFGIAVNGVIQNLAHGRDDDSSWVGTAAASGENGTLDTINYDLGQNVGVEGFYIWNDTFTRTSLGESSPAGVNQMELFTSTDGTNYTSQGTYNVAENAATGDAFAQAFTFPLVTARYIKINIISVHGTVPAFAEFRMKAVDTDNDGFPDIRDTDTDNDGVLDANDFYPSISLGGRTDTDGDGIPDDCDATCTGLGMAADFDDDNDGFSDAAETAIGSSTTTAAVNGSGGYVDQNNNNIDDRREDADGNGVIELAEALFFNDATSPNALPSNIKTFTSSLADSAGARTVVFEAVPATTSASSVTLSVAEVTSGGATYQGNHSALGTSKILYPWGAVQLTVSGLAAGETVTINVYRSGLYSSDALVVYSNTHSASSTAADEANPNNLSNVFKRSIAIADGANVDALATAGTLQLAALGEQITRSYSFDNRTVNLMGTSSTNVTSTTLTFGAVSTNAVQPQPITVSEFKVNGVTTNVLQCASAITNVDPKTGGSCTINLHVGQGLFSTTDANYIEVGTNLPNLPVQPGFFAVASERQRDQAKRRLAPIVTSFRIEDSSGNPRNRFDVEGNGNNVAGVPLQNIKFEILSYDPLPPSIVLRAEQCASNTPDPLAVVSDTTCANNPEFMNITNITLDSTRSGGYTFGGAGSRIYSYSTGLNHCFFGTCPIGSGNQPEINVAWTFRVYGATPNDEGITSTAQSIVFPASVGSESGMTPLGTQGRKLTIFGTYRHSQDANNEE